VVASTGADTKSVMITVEIPQELGSDVGHLYADTLGPIRGNDRSCHGDAVILIAVRISHCHPR